MVNHGWPSRDCLPCRRRKLRCDLLPDGCGQCRRAKLQCHGYRGPHELLFRDETYSTEQKVLTRQALAYAGRPTVLELGWEVRARYAFFSVYVFGFSRSCDAVPLLYSRTPASDHLSASVEATSLAFMAIQLNSTDLMRLANRSYVTAIQRLCRALNEIQSLETEKALQSALLLDIYEKIVNRNPRSSPSWMSHAQGGMSLFETHRKKILSSCTGRQLAARLATALTVSCAAAAVRVPEVLMVLHRDLDLVLNSVKWSFLGILAHVVDLQADIHESRGVYPIGVIARARQLDNRLKSLGGTLPPSWKPRRVYCIGYDPRIFGYYYDIYPDHFVTQVSNGICATRLMLNDIIQRHSPDGLSSVNSDVLTDIRDVTQQICAAVPQFVLPGARPDNTIPFSPLQGLQCRTLLAPLYLASQISADHSMRDWIRECMKYMLETGCMKAANDVVDLIKDKPGLDYWTVFSLVGSYAFTA